MTAGDELESPMRALVAVAVLSNTFTGVGEACRTP